MNFLCECIVHQGRLCATCEHVALYAARLLFAEHAETVEEKFADFVRAVHKTKIPSALLLVMEFIGEYPEYVGVRQTASGAFEIFFLRAQFAEVLRKERPAVILTSVERGLKHAGLFVSQSTHSGVVKEWRFRNLVY